MKVVGCQQLSERMLRIRESQTVLSFVGSRISKTHPDGWVSSLELLARFELATRLHEIPDFMEASRPRIEIDEVASSRFQ